MSLVVSSLRIRIRRRSWLDAVTNASDALRRVLSHTHWFPITGDGILGENIWSPARGTSRAAGLNNVSERVAAR